MPPAGRFDGSDSAADQGADLRARSSATRHRCRDPAYVGLGGRSRRRPGRPQSSSCPRASTERPTTSSQNPSSRFAQPRLSRAAVTRGDAMKALGIDPGLSGALAIVEFIGGIPVLVDTIDMPSTGTGAKARVDIIAAASWIAKHAPSTAYVERAQAFPGQGASSGFSYGRSVGAIEAVVALCQIPMTLVDASAWKRRLHLPGKDKEAARQRALQLFPSQHALLALKKWHGRAEAALLVIASLERAQ